MIRFDYDDAGAINVVSVPLEPAVSPIRFVNLDSPESCRARARWKIVGDDEQVVVVVLEREHGAMLQLTIFAGKSGISE